MRPARTRFSIVWTQGGGGFGLELHSSIPGVDVGSLNGLIPNTPFTDFLFKLQPQQVPEPMSAGLALMGLGALGAALRRRRAA
jgi:MYXO-CTERM domain-containing protein